MDNRIFKPVIRRKALWLGGLILLWIIGLPFLFSLLRAQTSLAPWQVRSSIQAVEWAKCEWSGTNADGKISDCHGLEMYCFRLADGTITEPYIAIKAGLGVTQDPIKWRRIPIQ